jgi:cell division protein FtsW (lipid II flippase)
MTLPGANKIIDGMKDQPALLLLLVLQLATLLMIYFISTANADRVHERELALIEACKEQ